MQRVGLSATVGNPEELLHWLQGSGAGKRPARVVAPDVETPDRRPSSPADVPPPPGEIELDHVGSVPNAATVIAALHRGEKRLVFCESGKLVEELGEQLRLKGLTTFSSHASLSVDERRRAEQAFAEACDCVIVSTSTLELGIDVGDLDRVIQIDAPATLASFLQRLGRTGRRPGAVRNCLFLALSREGLLATAALLLQWSRGWVEPVIPPPEPRHIVAQQMLALCLQEHQVGEELWPRWWGGLGPFGKPAAPMVRHLIEQGYLDRDGGMLFIGPEAEWRFGHRHFMNLTAVFTAAPEFTVLYGRSEIGTTDPDLLTEEVTGPRRLLLAGRSWEVTYIDWHRKRCFVEPVDGGGKAKWSGLGFEFASSRELTRAMREVLLGADPPVKLTQRADDCLAEARERLGETVYPGGTVIVRTPAYLRWWTWAGYRANVTLAATLEGIAVPAQRANDCWLRLREDLTPQRWKQATDGIQERLCLPDVDERAVKGLKFGDTLPPQLAQGHPRGPADRPGRSRPGVGGTCQIPLGARHVSVEVAAARRRPGGEERQWRGSVLPHGQRFVARRDDAGGQVRGGHVRVEGVGRPVDAAVSEADEVLVDATRGEGEFPVGGHVEQLRLEVADLDDDDIGRARVQRQRGEVVLVVVGLAEFR